MVEFFLSVMFIIWLIICFMVIAAVAINAYFWFKQLKNEFEVEKNLAEIKKGEDDE